MTIRQRSYTDSSCLDPKTSRLKKINKQKALQLYSYTNHSNDADAALVGNGQQGCSSQHQEIRKVRGYWAAAAVLYVLV